MLKNNCIVYADEVLESIDHGEDISLTNCTIQGGASSHLTLINTTVDSMIRVVRCAFEIKVSFENVIFTKDVSFEGTWFYQVARFSKVEFQGNGNFGVTRFMETADFCESRFPGIPKVEVADAMRGETIFSDTRFNGPADFSKCEFFNARFTDAMFNSDVGFSQARFSREVSFARAIFQTKPEIDIDEIEFDPETKGRTLRSLGQAYRNSHLNREAAQLFDRSANASEEMYRGTGAKEDYDNVVASYRLAEETYDSVKEWKEAGKAYKKAMDFRVTNPEYLGIFERIWLCTRKYTSNYGESTGLFLFCIFATVTFFALTYLPSKSQQWRSPWIFLWLIPAGLSLTIGFAFRRLKRVRWTFVIVAAAIMVALPLSFVVEVDECDIFACHNVRFHDVIRAFYFSFNTFTTLGSGDVAPLNNAAAIVVSFEVLSGYVMFGVLLTMLARKMIR